MKSLLDVIDDYQFNKQCSLFKKRFHVRRLTYIDTETWEQKQYLDIRDKISVRRFKLDDEFRDFVSMNCDFPEHLLNKIVNHCVEKPL